MSYVVDGEQHWESTGTTSKPAAGQIWKRRQAEVALGKFKVGWPGKRITFEESCAEFERSHLAGIPRARPKAIGPISGI